METNSTNSEAQKLAEQSALYYLLNGYSAVESGLKAAMLCDQKHRIIFQAIVRVEESQKTPDYLTVIKNLEDSNLLDAAGGSGTITAFGEVAVEKSASTCFAMLMENYQLRESDREIQEVLKEDSLQDRSQRLGEIKDRMDRQSQAKGITAFETIEKTLELEQLAEDGKLPMIPTGLPKLDSLLGGGFALGEYIILGARPSIGKSALAINIMERLCNQEKRILFTTLEMSPVEVLRRIHRGKKDAQNNCSNFQLVFFDNTSEASEVIRGLKQAHHSEPADLIIIDHFHLLREQREKDFYRERTLISNKLQALARELNIPVFALCQLNRDGEDRPPTMAMLRDSGAIEQDADKILLLHRDKKDPSKPAELELVKNRNGRTGKAELNFCGETTTFTECTVEEARSRAVSDTPTSSSDFGSLYE